MNTAQRAAREFMNRDLFAQKTAGSLLDDICIEGLTEREVGEAYAFIAERLSVLARDYAAEAKRFGVRP